VTTLELPPGRVVVKIRPEAEQRLPALGVFPFLFCAWYGVSLWRGLRRRVWCYVFTGAFMLLADPFGDGVPVRWDQVTQVGPVWTQVHDPVAEEPKTVLGGYRLRTADGRTHEISRSFKNVEDPYREMGQLFRTLAPDTIGTTMPTFPTVGQIIAAYAGNPGRPRQCGSESVRLDGGSWPSEPRCSA
jgi:hypothetical protein